MVAGDTWPEGDPFLQRQNEPSIAASTRNPLHLLAGANDYRTVDLPGLADDEIGDAWLGLFKSYDGGQRWTSTLLPGYPQDESPLGVVSPIKGYGAAADPVLRAGTNGLIYYAGLVFDRANPATPDVPGKSAIFVARYIDNNNKEAGDTFEYLGTRALQTDPGGVGGNFLDKPWMTVDIPRDATRCTIVTPGEKGPITQSVPAGPVYVAYTLRSTDNKGARYDVMFTRSVDCGNTWTVPVKLNSNSERANQGATMAVDPRNGDVYISWRQFDLTTNGTGTDALMIAKYVRSTNSLKAPGHARKFAKPKNGKGKGLNPEHFFKRGGVNKALEAAELTPLDQSTSAQMIRFRTNAYPTMTVDENGRVYLAWAERGYDPLSPDPVLGSARVLMATSANGQTWTNPATVSNEAQRGHQLMPSLTYAGGKLMLIYYDVRETRSQSFTQYIDDRTAFANPQATGLRHTIDLRASMAAPGATPIFGNSAKVSEYIEGPRVPGGPNVPWQVNPPNLPMFQKGTAPFIGDYIDIAAAPQFILDAAGKWIHNTAPTTTLPIFHAAWTDNRDVRPPLEDRNGDGNPWNDYTPPGAVGAVPSIFDPTQTVPQCVPGNAGSRNQNVYTARITGGLLVGSPGNAKTLSPELQRGFVVFVQNTGEQEKVFRLTITNQPVGGRASWNQFPLPPYNAASEPPLTVIEATIPRVTVASRTVYVTSTDPHASINIFVEEINGLNGTPVPGGLDGKVILNPDIDNPDIDNPDIDNPDIDNPDIDNAEVYNPDIDNPDIDNPDIDNPDIDNPDIDNPDIDNVEVANPDIDNPDIDNPDIDNPDIDNPDIDNPDIDNPDIDNASLMTDVSWPITNTGNTTAAYNVNLFFAQTQFDPSISTQLILFRTYRTPVVQNCLLKFETRNVIVANVPNPQLVKSSTGQVSNPNDPERTNATIYLAPGESAKITLRIFDPSPDPGSTVTVTNADGSTAIIPNQFVPNEDVTPVVQQQAVDSEDAEEGVTEPPIEVQFPAPDTVADSASTAENTPVKFNVLANDSTAFGSTKIISYHPEGMAAHSGGGVGDIAFQPSTGFVYTQRGAVDPSNDRLVGRFNLPPGTTTAGIVRQIANPRTGINYARTSAIDSTSISALDARPDSELFHQYLLMPPISGQVIGMELDAVHGFLYVLHGPSQATPISPTTLTVIDINPQSETFHNVVRTVALPQGVRGQAVAVNNRTQRVYVTTTGVTGSAATAGVFLFDATNPAAGATRVPNSVSSWSVTINEAANLVFATSQTGNQAVMAVIDGATNALAAVPLGVPMRFGPNDERLVVHEASGKVYYRGQAHVVIFDGQRGSPTRNTVLGLVGVGRESGQTDLAVDQELGLVITVGNYDFQADIIDVASNSLIETLPVRFSPTDVAIDQLTHRAFVGIGLAYVQEVDLTHQELREATPVFIEAGGVLLNPATNKGYAGLFTVGPSLLQVSGAGFEGPVSDPGNLVPTAGRFLYGVWHHGSNQGFIVNWGSPDSTGSDPGSVIVVDGATSSVSVVGDVLPNPFGIGVDQETGHLYVASNSGINEHGGITRGNANNLEEDFDNPTGPNGLPMPDGFPLLNPGALMGFTRNPIVNPANHKVYVQVAGGTFVSLAMLDPATNRVHPLDGVAGTPIYDHLNPAACGGAGQPVCQNIGRANTIAVDASLNRVFVGFGDQTTGNRIIVLDSATDTVVGEIAAGAHSFRHAPSYLVVNQASNEIYVTDYNNDTIQKYNSATLAPVGPALTLPAGPSAMAYNALAKRIYVSSIDDKMLTAIDAGRMEIMSTVRLPLVAYFLYVDEIENRIYTSGGDSSDESGVMIVTDILGQLGTNVSVTSVGNPQHGTAVLNADNSVTYTPEFGYSGADQFTYNIAAPTGTAVGTVHINVVASEPRRLAFGDSYNAAAGQELNVPAPGPLGNDAAGGSMTVTSLPEHGVLVADPEGSFSYTPAAEYTGPDAFAYRVTSESGDSNEVIVTLNVNPSVDLVVTNTNDAGAGSLRAAINIANVEPGATIRFDIDGAGPHVIVPGSALPALNVPMTIDGYSEPDAAVNTAAVGTNAVIAVRIDGGSAGGGVHGLTINGGGTTIRGLAIGGFNGDGIFIDAQGGNVIEGNFIGTLDGVNARPNGNGGIVAQAGGNMIGGNTLGARNLIAGNVGQAGIRLQPRHTNGVVQSDASGTVVKGNLIGTTATGLAALPNGNGINVQVSNVTIGGLEFAAERNVIAGNANNGIATNASTFDSDGNGPALRTVVTTPDHLRVFGNYIGIRADGSGALGNSTGGATLNGSFSEVIGNVISGNTNYGIHILSDFDGSLASPTYGRAWTVGDHTIIRNNIVGLDPTGTFAVENTGSGGIVVTAPDVVIGGSQADHRNVISGNAGMGIQLQTHFVTPAAGGPPFAVSRVDGVKGSGDNAVIRGNYIGLSASGNVLIPNTSNAINALTAGLQIGGPNAADGNYIALGTFNGVNLTRQTFNANVINAGGSSTFQNNVVGLLVNGTRTSGGGNFSIAVAVQTADNAILNNVIAGNGMPGPPAPAGPGTSVSGLSFFDGLATGNTVRGNFIGTNAAGAAGLGNTNRGIQISNATNNTIGGVNAGDRNVVSGNGNFGISFDASSGITSGNAVLGNYVGVRPDGFTPLGNTGVGINMFAGGGAFITGNTIGGTSFEARNTIGGNTGDGISLGGVNAGGTHHNTIVGNWIGVSSSPIIDGLVSVPNGGNGIFINNATDNTLGGAAAVDGNRIANNAGRGIVMQFDGRKNRILSNSIYANGNLGIDLGFNGPTANDAGDGDTGANELQNFPVLSNANNSGDFTAVDVDMSSFAPGGYTVQFFASATCDASGFGEGERLVGTATMDPAGALNHLLQEMVPAGHYITATATDNNGNTSEFSACAQIDGTVVVNENESGPGSLRQAILDANARPGAQTISFNIPGASSLEPAVITINNALAAITESVIIDGATQPGYDGTRPAVELTTFEGVDNGLVTDIGVSDVTIRALMITRFDVAGIVLLQADGAAANTGHVVEYNFIGTDRNGDDGRANGMGIEVRRDHSRIRGNVISGNDGAGILVNNDADNVRIDDNLIGLTPNGNFGLRNLTAGILMYDYPNNALIENNHIAGNDGYGIDIQDSNQPPGPVTGTIIRGNKIGLNSASAAIGNTAGGIRLADAPATQIGEPGRGNVIGGNGGPGVWVVTSNDNHPLIRGNRIGTDATGNLARPNIFEGIRLSATAMVGGDSSLGQGNLITGNGVAPEQGAGIVIEPGVFGASVYGNVIGLTADGNSMGNGFSGITVAGNSAVIGGTGNFGNVISGNPAAGIAIYPMPEQPMPSGILIRNNKIGTSVDGLQDRGNGLWGITINADSSDIGSNVAGEGNLIAFNGNRPGSRGGIHVCCGSNEVTIRGNSIHSNNGLGIDLHNYGPTANDAGDADEGANTIQNFPVLISAVNNGGPTNVAADLSSFAGGSSYEVQFFASPSCNPSGYGEGRTLVATYSGVDVPAPGWNFLMDVQVPNGQFITAVATDSDGSTSEFSNCAMVAFEPGTTWAAGGSGSTTVLYNGTTYMPRMTYQNNGEGMTNGTWTFTTTSATDGNISIGYEWTGFHSFFQVRAGMEVFIIRDDEEIYTKVVLDEGPEDCGACNPPSGGFTYLGTEIVNVQPGDLYGFRLTGSHNDGTWALQGNLLLTVRP